MCCRFSCMDVFGLLSNFRHLLLDLLFCRSSDLLLKQFDHDLSLLIYLRQNLDQTYQHRKVDMQATVSSPVVFLIVTSVILIIVGWCLSLHHSFIQQSLRSGFGQVQILLAACQKFAMVRICDIGPSWKQELRSFVSKPFCKNSSSIQHQRGSKNRKLHCENILFIILPVMLLFNIAANVFVKPPFVFCISFFSESFIFYYQTADCFRQQKAIYILRHQEATSKQQEP